MFFTNFIICLLVTCIHLAVSYTFFPILWEFYMFNIRCVYRRWTVPFLCCAACVGAAIWGGVITWVGSWMYIILATVEVFSYLRAYKLNKG